MRLEERLAVGIVGMGSYVPEKIVTNKDLSVTVSADEEWIFTRTGMLTRHVALPQQATSDLAVMAARRALQEAKISPDDIGLVIVATSTPDMLFPATACLVQDQLGCSQAAAFDLSAGCSGFLYAMMVGAQFIANQIYRNVLVIGAEVLTRVNDPTDRETYILFGDGAGAAVIGAVPPEYGILATQLGCYGDKAYILYLPAGGARLPASEETVQKKLHFTRMNGREVFKWAVMSMSNCSEQVLAQTGISIENIDFLVPHQANQRIIDACAKRLGIPLEKVLINLDRYGNTSAATIPLVMEEAFREGKIKNGHHLLLTASGTGFTWGAMLMRWYDYKLDRKKE